MKNYFIYLERPDKKWVYTSFYSGWDEREDCPSWNRRFFSLEDIQIEFAKIKSWAAKRKKEQEAQEAATGYIRTYPSSYNFDNLKIGCLEDLPCPTHFEGANILDVNNIPELDRDVKIIDRFGNNIGCTTNFLREEMLKGRCFENPEYMRWIYIPDSLFLQCKKAGLH